MKSEYEDIIAFERMHHIVSNHLDLKIELCSPTVEAVRRLLRAFERKNPQTMLKRFKDLPKGARFKYPNSTTGAIFVVLETHGRGKVAGWDGWDGCEYAARWQSLCCFCDDEWTLESEVEVLCV